jgi:hypothetical protein
MSSENPSSPPDEHNVEDDQSFESSERILESQPKVEKKIPKDFFKKQKKKHSPKKMQIIPPDERPTGRFNQDMEIFFKQLARSYKERYALWENTFSSVIAMLRKVRNIHEKNVNAFLEGIDLLEEKIQKCFREFEIKRKAIERFSASDLEDISQEFKQTIDLLRMQVKEFALQKEVKNLSSIYL